MSKSSFGLRAKVDSKIKELAASENMHEDAKVIGRNIDMYEEAYRFYESAGRMLSEVGCIPRAFYDLYDDNFELKLHLKGLWKWLFGKEEPYTTANVLDWKEEDDFGLYKRWYVSAKNYIKQQKDHYASEYFAAIIVYWHSQNWVVSPDDLWSDASSLAARSEKTWKLSESWINKLNNYTKVQESSNE